MSGVTIKWWRYAAGALMCCVLLCRTTDIASAQTSRIDFSNATEKKALIDSFELIWSTLRDRYWDPSMAGLNWHAIHEQYLQKIRTAKKPEQARQLMSEMIERLPSSHLAVIPEWAYDAHERKDSLSPPHNPKKPEEDNDEVAGEGTTGLTVAVIEGAAVVEGVEKGSAAMESGIRTGWKIESVDGQPVKELFSSIRMTQVDAKASLIAEIVEQWLSGPVGSQVHVSFARGDGTHASL